MPTRPTPITITPTTGRLAVLVAGLLAAGIAAAPAALAAHDLSRPDAQVLQGPSCHPGGVVIEVTAGTEPYSVVLATTRHPEGEDAALLSAGETVLLRTGDVDWGETIDSRLEYVAQDGSGVSYVDELEPFSFTRPSREDCAAIGSTAAGAPAPATVPTPMVVPVPPDAGLDPSPAPGALPADGGTGLQLSAAAVGRPVAPVTRSVDWPPVVAGAALLLSAGGLVLTGLRRRAGARRGAPIAGA